MYTNPTSPPYSFYGHEMHKKRGHGIIRNPLILCWRRRDLNPRPPPCEGDYFYRNCIKLLRSFVCNVSNMCSKLLNIQPSDVYKKCVHMSPPHPHLARFRAISHSPTPASLAAIAYEAARICTTGGNGLCPPTCPRQHRLPCVANSGRQICLTAMPGSTEFHPASHKKARLKSDPVLSASISNSLSFKHPAPASRPQY